MERDLFFEEFKPSKNRGQSDKEVPCLECKPTPATVRTSNITHTHIFCSGLSGIQTFMFAMATSILSIISFPPCQICRVSYFFWVDNSQIKNAHKNTHTHTFIIYPSIHLSRHVSWQSSLLKCGNNFKSSFVLPLPSPSFSWSRATRMAVFAWMLGRKFVLCGQEMTYIGSMHI